MTDQLREARGGCDYPMLAAAYQALEAEDMPAVFFAAERALNVDHREDDQPCGCDECMAYGAEDEGADWYRIPPVNRLVMRVLDSGDDRLAPLATAFRDHEAAALATPSPDADLRAAVTASPWSFEEGTLRERLEWAREQHQRAAEATDLEAERAISPTWASLDTYTSWHRACADWYAGMVRDLDAAAATPSPDTLDAILGSLSEDDLMYDHPVAMSGEPMDQVLFVRWDALTARLREPRP